MRRKGKYWNWRGLSFLIVLIGGLIPLMATPLQSAELLTFPSGQSQPQQRTAEPQIYKQFLQKIVTLNCAELSQLREDLMRKCTASEERRDKDYYESLVSILNDVRTAKRCP
jgi:hypothetical protein